MRADSKEKAYEACVDNNMRSLFGIIETFVNENSPIVEAYESVSMLLSRYPIIMVLSFLLTFASNNIWPILLVFFSGLAGYIVSIKCYDEIDSNVLRLNNTILLSLYKNSRKIVNTPLTEGMMGLISNAYRETYNAMTFRYAYRSTSLKYSIVHVSDITSSIDTKEAVVVIFNEVPDEKVNYFCDNKEVEAKQVSTGIKAVLLRDYRFFTGIMHDAGDIYDDIPSIVDKTPKLIEELEELVAS